MRMVVWSGRLKVSFERHVWVVESFQARSCFTILTTRNLKRLQHRISASCLKDSFASARF